MWTLNSRNSASRSHLCTQGPCGSVNAFGCFGTQHQRVTLHRPVTSEFNREFASLHLTNSHNDRGEFRQFRPLVRGRRGRPRAHPLARGITRVFQRHVRRHER